MSAYDRRRTVPTRSGQRIVARVSPSDWRVHRRRVHYSTFSGAKYSNCFTASIVMPRADNSARTSSMVSYTTSTRMSPRDSICCSGSTRPSQHCKRSNVFVGEVSQKSDQLILAVAVAAFQLRRQQDAFLQQLRHTVGDASLATTKLRVTLLEEATVPVGVRVHCRDGFLEETVLLVLFFHSLDPSHRKHKVRQLCHGIL